MRQVILQGMGKGIVCLPVDDAAAVLQQHEKWAVDAMLKAWKRVVSTNGIWAGARTCLFFVRNPDWKSLSKRSKTKFMVIGKGRGPMEANLIQSYVDGDHKIGFDRYLILQLNFDGWIASKFGITAMAPTGFIVGFALAYFVF